MKVLSLKNMKAGWFIGNFKPAALESKEFEVACKYYNKGYKARPHIHKVASEITLVVYGRVKMCGQEMQEGELVLLEPGEVSDFEALEDSATVVVKTPSIPHDKYYR